MSRETITFIAILVPTFILACLDIGLISIVRWLLRRDR